MKNKILETWMSILIFAHLFVFIIGLICFLYPRRNSSPKVNDYDFKDPIEVQTTVDTQPELVVEDNTVLPQTTSETEASTEEVSIEEPTADTIEETDHYHFVATHYRGNLHIRTGPSLAHTIITSIRPGDGGIVLEKGDQWSLVSFEQNGNTITGYVFNGYINMTLDESGQD